MPDLGDKTMNINKTNLTLIIGAVLMSLTIFVSRTKAVENGRIAFESNNAIWTMNPNGGARRQVADSGSLPVFSPDGTKIAFFRADGIYVMNANGSNQTFVTLANYETNQLFIIKQRISWSPDGNRLAFTCNGICIVNINGNNRMNISSNANDYAPDWSPDGTKIAFTRQFDAINQEIFVMNANDGSNQTRLTTNTEPDFAPVWSPDGAKLAFTQYGICIVLSNGEVLCFASEIYTMNADGSSTTFLTGGDVFDGIPAFYPAWSPDGTKITYAIWDGDIWVINANGTNPINLTNTSETTELYPNWGTAPASPNRTAFDFDGDGRADISVFRPSDRVWYLNQSTAGFSATQFGLSSDKIVPADFDGDGKTDIAVFRDGIWYWLKSSNSSFNTLQFGLAGDVPVAGDYTGDGRAELAVYRNGTWWTLDLTNYQVNAAQFGLPDDKPVAADYDGDGKTDQAVYRNGEWHLNRSSQGYAVVNFGLATDKPVIGDYDGDGKADEAVYRAGTWYVLRSSQGFAAFQFGIASDTPAPADYDGDGKTDAAVYRDGTWWILQSTNGNARSHQFGLANDSPIPAAFVP